MEFGGVGRGWFLVAGTLLASTAVKLSRPRAFGISRAEDAMLAIVTEVDLNVSLKVRDTILVDILIKHALGELKVV